MSAADRPTDLLRYAGIVAILLVGGIHLQQHDSFIGDVPTIGTLFLLNAAGAAAIALALAAGTGRLALVAALGGIGLSAGAIVALLVARYGTIFDYTEPTFRAGVVLSLVFEVLAVVILAGLIVRFNARRSSPSPR